MTALAWDQPGERVFQTGIDRGVLYLPDGSGVVWNGLISVTEISNREIRQFYLDGVKYLEHHVLGDFSAELKAFTYPAEFDELNGIVVDDGILFHDQPPQSFGLSYRTMIGNDVDVSEGYKIHILYSLMADPSDTPFTSLSNVATAIQFGWNLSGVPTHIQGHRPTCHISIDSTKVHPAYLALLEDQLYGTNTTDPTLPSLSDLLALDTLVIVDNGDGTWTAIGSSRLITVSDSGEFQITEADATYLDADTYEISSST